MKRVFIFSFIYCLLVYIFCLCFVIFQEALPNLLPGMFLAYRLQTALLLFCSLLPSVLVTAYIIAYSTIFNKIEKKPLLRFSSIMMKYFKKIAIAAILGSAFITITNEIFIPVLNSSIDKMEKAPALYAEYIKAANNNLNKKSYDIALQYAEAAQKLYPKSEQTQIIKENCEVFFDTKSVSNTSNDDKTFIYTEESYIPENNATSFDFLQRAMVLFLQEEWINAHYYSMLALSAAEPGSANETDAKILAADSWNKLSEAKVYHNVEEEILYKRKTDAYKMLIAGDIIGSYYAFTELINKSPSDPDIIRYHNIAAHEMAKQYFFFDELPESGLLGSNDNICFYTTNANGSFYVVYIKGTASVQGTGKKIQYLKDLSVYKYTRNGTFEMSFYVPYAKAVSHSLSSFDENTRNYLGLKDKDVSVPLIMLEAADRNTKTYINKPVYTFEKNTDKTAEQMPGFIVLPMDYEDFLLISSVSFNPENMTLFDLFKFVNKAQQYGYSKEVYIQTLCSRIETPLLYLVVFILSAVLGWNYRLMSKTRFRLSWFLYIPVITAIFYCILISITYLLKLINFGLIEILGIYSIPAIIVCFILILIYVSILFVSRKV